MQPTSPTVPIQLLRAMAFRYSEWFRWWLLHPPDGHLHAVTAGGVRADLVGDGRDDGPHPAARDAQRGGDLLVGHRAGDELGDLPFALRQISVARHGSPLARRRAASSVSRIQISHHGSPQKRQVNFPRTDVSQPWS